MAKKKKDRQTKKLFKDQQIDMFEKSYEEELEAKRNQPVECLGMTFENDGSRREYFLNILRKKLKDPGFRKNEGFPIGEDQDILALSDPPYYTACPNPFIGDFVEYHRTPFKSDVDYQCEAFAVDSSFGKTSNALTRAHPYHTKVPPGAVQSFVDHYIPSSGIIIDSCCGIGMAGVGVNLHNAEKGANVATILCDLSTISTFASYNYNSVTNAISLSTILSELSDELETRIQKHFTTAHNGWLASSKQKDIFTRENLGGNNSKGLIQYVILSEELTCPNCGTPNLLWRSECVDTQKGKILDEFPCVSCGQIIAKAECSKIWETKPDPCIPGKTWKVFRQRPVLIYYEYNGKSYCKIPDSDDVKRLNSYWDRNYPNIPISKIPKGDKTNELINGNNFYFHHCFHPLILCCLNELFDILVKWKDHSLIRKIRFALSPLFSSLTRMSVLHVSNFFKGGGGSFISNISGFLHFPSLSFLRNPVTAFRLRSTSIVKSENLKRPKWGEKTIVSCQSSTNLYQIPNDSIDYAFIDPPFGQNLMYSELNFFWETALGITTNSNKEAIVNKTQNKDLKKYQSLMTEIFSEINRVLKPGRWLTVEFHNSKNIVWNAIQEAIEESRFVVADVRILDKKLGSYNQNVSAGATKSDLIISAYKPHSELEERFQLTAGTEEGVWEIIRTHLKQLPVFVSKNGKAEVIAERQNYLLFDRMIAFHVQRGITMPLSASEFYLGLEQRFPPRDDMYFLPEQAVEYDKKRLTVKEVLQLQLFVSDEASAIQWLKQQLTKKPQAFKELQPAFMDKTRAGWQKHEKPIELVDVLEQNFLQFDGKGEVPSQIHSYLSSNYRDYRNLSKDNPLLKSKAKDRWYVPDPNKAVDLEKLRERALLREFTEYRESKQKRLKVFRLEAVRAGFKKAWQEKDYQTIIEVAKKIKENVLQEDPKLLMYYDQALTRSENGQ